MCSRSSYRVFAVLFAALLFSPVARAETIRLSGSFVADPGTPVSFELTGDRGGFRLFGAADIPRPNFQPFCESGGGSECLPGEAAPFQHTFGSDEFWSPNVTYQGVTYTDMTSLDSRATVFLGFATTVVLPPFGDLNTVMLSSPFVLEVGSFQTSDIRATLVGSGTATTTWNRVERDGSRWEPVLARYDFLAPAPVPEPTTLMLFGAAGLTAAWRRRRRAA
jgi:hypothetical protein